MNKNRNLIVSAATFFVGAIYIISDKPGMTANIVGMQGSPYAFASLIGIITIICSAIFFMMSLTFSNHTLARSQLGSTELERLVRQNENTHDEIKTAARKQELDEKYYNEHHQEEISKEKVKEKP